MKTLASSLASGFVFAVGLGVATMTQPDRIIRFLDFTGDWDPTLLFVMAGAVGMHFVIFRLIMRRESPLFAERFGIPTRRDIDIRLVGGAALFGLGWGLAGYCPGPGIVSLASGSGHAAMFVVAMTGGMLLFHLLDAFVKKPEPAPVQSAS